MKRNDLTVQPAGHPSFYLKNLLDEDIFKDGRDLFLFSFFRIF